MKRTDGYELENEGLSDEERILEVARQRFRLAENAEQQMRREAQEDLNFRAGEQWPDDVRRAREFDRRPTLTINRIPQFVRQITNDMRQNRPSIKVSPVDDKADPETAKIYQGIIRHIEVNSKADVAYDTASEGAVTKGFGYFRILTEYADPKSFELEIKIKRIRNAFSVYLDPSHQEPDGSDAEWGFIFEDLTKEEYRAQYPDSECASLSDFKSIGDDAPVWMPSGGIRVAEYFYKEYEEKEIIKLSNGEVILAENAPEFYPEGVEEVDRRKSKMPVIRWVKMNAVEVLEKTIWPGIYIPIIPVIGDEVDSEGQRMLEGIIRHAKDPQRMYNYWASAETEAIALAPKAPWIGAEGQFEGYEKSWSEANVRNVSFLQYKTVSVDGKPLPPPMRNVQEAPVGSITNARMLASDDMKSTTGVYDSALGNQGNETSGIAIQRRNMQSQTSNFHYVDNLARSIRHAGRILVDLIPKIYDTPRVIRVIGEEGDEQIVKVNQMFKDEKTQQERAFDLGHGKYDVTIETGPSYATKRQEAVASMLQLTQAYPQMFQTIGDLMLKNMDIPGAQEMAARIKKTLPPGIAESDDGVEVPPEMQAQMGQMAKQIEVMTQELNQKNDLIEKDQIKYAHELQIKEMEIALKLRELEAKLEIEAAKVDSQDSRELLRQEIAQLNALQAKTQQAQSDLDMNEKSQAGPEMGPGPEFN